MALNVYRRHGSHCPGGRKLYEMTYEADELRRSWKKCVCPIYASGILSGKFKRRNTETTVWESAKTVVQAWEGAHSWDSPLEVANEPPSSPIPDPPSSARIKIADAVAAYLAIRQGARIAPATLRKYRTFAKQLCDFSVAAAMSCWTSLPPPTWISSMRHWR
jgi:hypothetical protein